MLLFGGMLFQGIAIVALIKVIHFETFGLIGALFRSCYSASISQLSSMLFMTTHPSQRAEVWVHSVFGVIWAMQQNIVNRHLADHFGIDS